MLQDTKDPPAEPLSPAKRIGIEVQRLRQAKRMTLRELAEESGRSAGYLSMLENGRSAPSLETVSRIAAALRVDVNWFFPETAGPDDRERDVVVRASGRRRISSSYSFDTVQLGYQDFLLSANLGLDVCMGLSRLEAGGRTVDAPASWQGHICGLVLRGRIELILEDESFVIESDDSFSFDSARSHGIRNAHSDVTEFVWAISPTRLDF